MKAALFHEKRYIYKIATKNKIDKPDCDEIWSFLLGIIFHYLHYLDSGFYFTIQTDKYPHYENLKSQTATFISFWKKWLKSVNEMIKKRNQLKWNNNICCCTMEWPSSSSDPAG